MTIAKYENHDGTNTNADQLFALPKQAMTFTVGATAHTITSIKAKLSTYDGPTTKTITASIRATSSGLPILPALVSKTSNVTVPSTIGFVEIVFDYPLVLLANTMYALIMQDSAETSVWGADYDNYANGNKATSVNGAADGTDGTWGASSYDFFFEIYGDIQVGVGVIAGGKLIKTSSANKLETTNSGGRCYYYTSSPASGKSATNRLLSTGKLIDV